MKIKTLLSLFLITLFASCSLKTLKQSHDITTGKRLKATHLDNKFFSGQPSQKDFTKLRE